MIIINNGKTIVQGQVAELLNSQEIMVLFKIDLIDKAIMILNASEFSDCEKTVKDSQLLIHTSIESISIINKLFCDNDIKVSSIEIKRKLEDYFLRLINS
jgi:ABC-2 type transport system ATP-binding protein